MESPFTEFIALNDTNNRLIDTQKDVIANLRSQISIQAEVIDTLKALLRSKGVNI